MTRAPGVEEGSSTEFLFDVQALAIMDEAGVFGCDGQRIELRHGRLVRMAPVGSGHADTDGFAGRELWRTIFKLGRPELRVITGTLEAGLRNAPIPDAFVVSGPCRGRYYVADEAVLVVEVSVSSLQDDLTDKRDVYAQAGVPEYWVLDREGETLHRFVAPHAGVYARHERLRPGDRVSPLFAEGRAEIAVADLFA